MVLLRVLANVCTVCKKVFFGNYPGLIRVQCMSYSQNIKFLNVMMSGTDLFMWPSGQRTQSPCAVERDTLSGRGSTQPGRVHLPKNYF